MNIQTPPLRSSQTSPQPSPNGEGVRGIKNPLFNPLNLRKSAFYSFEFKIRHLIVLIT